MMEAKSKVEGTGRYKLAPGAQVRKEAFGLLFYHKEGPRLYFLNCGSLLGEGFFGGEHTLENWLCRHTAEGSISLTEKMSLNQNLIKLKKKGVILEC